jgi:GAF domain-containing protein/HAMP domain-containing protein
LAVIGVVALLAVLLAVGISLLLTRGIADSLARLAEAATQIASGDVTRLADVEQDDEVGTVAQAFNAMTRQLRELIGNLEHRVAERTAALEQRSAYLQASAEVGRTAASILEADRLIQQVVDLIRERFGLYYVGLFAVDEAGEWAVLQAGTGKAGEAMLARGHRLQVGEDSMIGWSIAHAQARVALEAGEDAVRLATPELPETRSEAALPLRVRGQIIGALTVQHTQPGAFNQDAIVALQTMADQVAVALDNARLFTERQEALEAAHRAYGVLSREAWEELLHARPDLGFRCDKLGVVQGAGVRRPETEQALQSGQIVRGDGASTDGRYFLALPIKVRGQTIGVLDTYKSAESGDWTSEEVVLMEAIVGQLDSALESARLFQDTQRRAARERAIRHVTERMRRAVEIEAILKTTVAELAGALGVPRAYVRLGTEAELNPRIGTDSQHLDRAAHTGDGEED